MRPLNSRVTNNARRIFNYRWSRERIIVESAFGMMVSKIHILETPIPTSIKLTKKHSMMTTIENVTTATYVQISTIK